MNRRARLSIAVLATVVLCSGTWEVASAVTSRHAGVSSTRSITACSTDAGYLRLADGHTCRGGTRKVTLARPATAPKALAVRTTSIDGRHVTRSASLIGGTKIQAECTTGSKFEDQDAYLKIIRSKSTQIDGTSFVVINNGGFVAFDHGKGEQSHLATGASSVYDTEAGSFQAASSGSGDYAALNTHLVITVPGAVYTVDAVVDVNDDHAVNSAAPYCRVSAVIQSATD